VRRRAVVVVGPVVEVVRYPSPIALFFPPESPPPIARFYYNRLSIIDERAGRVNRCLISCQSKAAAAARPAGRLSINNFARPFLRALFERTCADVRRRSAPDRRRFYS
jgi:hypothetical protein